MLPISVMSLFGVQFRRLSVGASLLLLVAGSSGIAGGSQNGLPDNGVPELAAAAQALTVTLVALNARYRAQGPDEGAILKTQLIDLAAERKANLAALIATAPGEVLKAAIPARLGRSMPAEVQTFLEHRRNLEGELQVRHQDYTDPARSRFAYILETKFGGRFSLHFATNPPALQSGTTVGVTGLLFDGVETDEFANTDGSVVVESGKANVLILECCDGDGGGGAAQAPELPNTFGAQSTVVFLVNFQDKQDEPWTAAEIEDSVFGTVSDFFMENSSGQTWLSGDVVGWYTIPLDSTVCDHYALRTQAHNAATAAGIDLADYDRFVYVFPKNACLWSGMGTVGGDPDSYTWANGTIALKIMAHELGHNLGLWHSHSLECGVTAIGNDCLSFPYGDLMDVMGNPNAGHFNAFQKKRLGWLGYGSSPAITTADTDGSFALGIYETDGTDPKALRILKSIDPVTGDKTWYYVAFRQALGFDGFLTGNVLNGVVVHTGTESDGNSSNLLDMTPESSLYYDWDDAALEVGLSFSDPDAGLTLTTEQVNATGAAVGVMLWPSACVPANPTISFVPSESQFGEPGSAVSFNVTVTNHDDPGCSAAAFDLTAITPLGWAAVIASPSLTLDPGANGTTTLDVTSPLSAAEGFYDTDVTARNAGDPAYAVTSAVTYVVAAAVNQSPVAVDDSATTDEDTAVTLDLLANDSDADGDALTITALGLPGQGSIVDNLDGTIIYTPEADYAGPDGFTYTVDDGNGGSDSATVAITIDPVNDWPMANDDSAVTAEDTALTLNPLANDSDVDGDALTITGLGAPGHGTIFDNGDGTVSYTPEADYAGPDSFGYAISDGNGGSAGATVVVTIDPVNDWPMANDDVAFTAEDTAITLNLLANDSDAEGDALTVTSLGAPVHGTVSDNGDGTSTYTPEADYAGPDSFSYTITDGNGGSAGATGILTVDPVNDPPVAVDDTVQTDKATSITIAVLTNDSDVDGDVLVVGSIGLPTNGTVVVDGEGTVNYTPDGGFIGVDSFDYSITDGQGGSADAVVTVSVVGSNDPPVAVDDEASTLKGTAVTVAVLMNDSDPNLDPLSITGVTQGSKGTVTFTAEGMVTYLPNPKAKNSDSFTYTISDGEDSATAAVNIVIQKDDGGGGGSGGSGGGSGGSGGGGGGKGKPK